MFAKEVEFQLWEDDASGGGHNTVINKNNHHTRTYKARVNEKGIAEVKIPLSGDERILRQIANKYLMKGDKSEGKNHEYYITASYHGKIQKASQVNVDIANPDYKKDSQKSQPKAPAKKPEQKKTTPQPEKPQPRQNTYKKPLPNNKPATGKNNQSDKDGRIIDVNFKNRAGKNFTTTPKFGKTIIIEILTKNVIGKHYYLRVWEDDTIGEYDLLYEGVHKITNDKQLVTFVLTKDRQQIGEIGNDPKNPDSGEYRAEWTDHQELFAEIAFADISKESTRLTVEILEEYKSPEYKKSAAKVKSLPKKENKGTCICQEQYKDLIWGGKVSCELRQKVFEICKNLWTNKYKDMANELMTCMALETQQSFLSSKGYPNATGLVQFTSGKYGAITAMNDTGYNGGKTITKDFLKNLTSVKQLDYVELYFKMWMEKYNKTINDALDMYMTIWCPSAVGKPDTFVCYSAERDKKSGNDFYESNKSAEFEYYDENEKIAINRLKKDSSKGNGEITKGELKPRLKYWKELGKNHKVKTFECIQVEPKIKNPIQSNSKIVFFDSELSEDRKKIVSQFAISVVEKAARNSSNSKVLITSTVRSTRKQAEVMYSNESNGKHISYAAPGKQIVGIYNTGKRRDDSKEKIISDMDSRIKELSKIGQRVSLHCVSDEVYKKHNILDISYKRDITNPRDLIKELVKDPAVTKIIHPLNNVVSNSKIKYDTKEDAIHVEIKIP